MSIALQTRSLNLSMVRVILQIAAIRSPDQTFSTFQKATWAGIGMKPVTLARCATGGDHCPSSAIGT